MPKLPFTDASKDSMWKIERRDIQLFDPPEILGFAATLYPCNHVHIIHVCIMICVCTMYASTLFI